MIRGTRNIIWILPLLLFVSTPLWKQALTDFLKPRGGFDTSADLLASRSRTFSMEDVQMVQNNKGRDEWHVDVKHLYTEVEKENQLQLEDVSAVFFGSKESPTGKKRTEIVSGEGIYDTDQKILTLSGGVTLRPENGNELRTRVLRYNEKERKMEASSGVSIQGDNFIVRGQNMAYDPDTGDFKVSGGVVGRTW